MSYTAWLTRSQPFGGWSELFRVPSINDTRIALLGAVALFLPVLLMMLSFCLFVTFMTELTSNTAMTAVLMPILAAGRFRISRMAKEGLAINMFGVLVIALIIYVMVIQRL